MSRRDLYIKAPKPVANIIADMFEGRVEFDSGTFEAKQCLIDFLTEIV